MRLLHPRTIEIVATSDIDFSKATSSRKQIISHAWSEVIKYINQDKSHPKVFIPTIYELGIYLGYVYKMNVDVGCNLNKELLHKYDEDLFKGFESMSYSKLNQYFDDIYLFSDAISLCYKGVNILPHIYGDKWRRYIPVENLNEISRQINKTINKRKVK